MLLIVNRSTTVSSTSAAYDKARYRGRVKEEYSRLRRDIRVLEAKLTHLQRTGSASKSAVPSVLGQQPWTISSPNDRIQVSSVNSSVARETAACEYKRRKQSETVNLKLKRLLARAQKASSTTKSVWDKLLAKQDIALLGEPKLRPICDSAQRRQLVAGHSNSVDSLLMRIDRLALDTDQHFDRAGLNDSHSFTFRTESAADSAFEIVMRSPLPCTKEHAASLINGLFDRGNKSDSIQTLRMNDTEIIHKAAKSIRVGQQQYKMEGIGTRRNVVEADRIRVIWSTSSVLLNPALSIEENCIMALQCTSESSHSCLLQIWYRVSVDFFSSDSQFDSKLKESVLRTHCRTTGEFFQSLEKMPANEVYNPYP